MRPAHRVRILASIIAVVTLGCPTAEHHNVTQPPGGRRAARVALQSDQATVLLGASVQLRAEVLDSADQPITTATVGWRSTNTGVAAVGSDGRVQAMALGSASIIASMDGLSDTARIDVEQIRVASLTVTPTAATVAVGGNTTLTATARDNLGAVVSGRVVTWQSSRPEVATVSNGVVSALASGTATIAAQVEGVAAPAVTITVPVVPVASVTLTTPRTQIALGETVQLTATPRAADNGPLSGRSVTWTSSTPGVATVSGSGLVSAVAAGSTTITATSEGRSGTVTISVTAPPPPPPPGAGEPVYSATQHALILRDDFNGYASRAAMLAAYPVGRRTEFVELTTGRGGSGGAARLKYGLTGGTYDIIFGPEERLGRVGAWNGTLPQKAGPYTHFYFSTWFRFSAGADPAAANNWGVKGFMFWHTGTQQGGRYQNAVNRSGADGQTRGPKGANPSNALSGLALYKTADGRPPLFSTLADGQWHRFTIELYAGSDPSGHRGQRYWLDGTLIYDDLGVTGIGQGTAVDHYDYAYAIRHWMVFGNFIDEASQSPYFTLDVDDWSAWTTP